MTKILPLKRCKKAKQPEREDYSDEDEKDARKDNESIGIPTKKKPAKPKPKPKAPKDPRKRIPKNLEKILKRSES